MLAEVQAGSAAQKAGLQAGDRIVKVDGQPLTQWMTFVNLVRDNPGKALALEIERQGSALPLTLTPDAKTVKGKAEGFAGWCQRSSRCLKNTRQYVSTDRLPPSLKPRIKRQLMSLTVRMLGKLITGDVKLNNLSGPISIAQGLECQRSLG